MKFRKHITQMTRNEKAFLQRLVRKRLRKMVASEHFKERRVQRSRLSEEDILKLFIFDGFDFIECHNEKSRKAFRVLMRSNRPLYDEQTGRTEYYCIVLDLYNNAVVTVYATPPQKSYYITKEGQYYNHEFYLQEKYHAIY